MAKSFTKHLYLLCDPDTGAVRYVGACVNPRKRATTHKSSRGCRQSPVALWVRGLYDQGKAPVMDALDAMGPDEWEDEERFLISYLRFLGFDLLNVNSGGTSGFKVSPANHKKCLDASVAARRGKKMSPELRAKMSERTKARLADRVARGLPVFPPEMIEKIRLANTGRVASQETKEKLRDIALRKGYRPPGGRGRAGPRSPEEREKMRASASLREAKKRAEKLQLASNQ